MDINVDLFNFFNHNLQNPLCDSIMPVITHFGGFKILVLLVIIIIISARLRRNDKVKKVFMLALAALLFAGAIAFCLKHAIHEPRPFISLDNVHLLINETDMNSFPSGHTTSTFAVLVTLMLNMKELTKKHYKVINIVLIVCALIIPFSRMYVGVHYPGDVLAGAAVGIFSAFVINRFKNQILNLVKWF